jgi:hypothetical protein
MKRKVKRYDEGGVLTDRYGNEVKSGSGETVKTRYGSSKEDRPTSSGVEDYASMGKRAGATSPFSGPKEYISESIKEDVDMPSKAASSDEESTAGKGARNLALEEPEIKVKKKTVIKKKAPRYEDTGAKIGSQDFKMKPSVPESSSGMGPRNTFLTRERLEKSKGIFSRMKSGGKVSSASSRGDGIAQRGKTKGRVC